MKFTALVLLLAVGSVSAFTSPCPVSPLAAFRTSSTSLEAHAHQNNGFVKAMAAGFAGLTLASQMAFGAPMIDNGGTPQHTVVMKQASPISSSTLFLGAFGAPSGVGGSSFETMDFTMPSYGDVNKSDGPKNAPPAFSNPFPDLALPRAAEESKPSADEAKQSAADAKQAAADAKQAAADAKEAAAAKKAEEKAARRAAELEKQKQASARSMADTKVEAAPAIVVPEFKAPEFKAPEFKAPEFKAQEFKAPEFKAQEFKAPEFKAPEFKAPEMPEMPKFDTSAFKIPEMPKFEAPKFDTSSFKAPDVAKFDTPAMPKLDVPEFKAPEFQLPAMPFSGGPAAPEEPLESQQVRDERAREARTVFLSFDEDAKELEAKARELRNLANEKKQLASEAKGEACKTHWGGKLLCLRPLNSGY